MTSDKSTTSEVSEIEKLKNKVAFNKSWGLLEANVTTTSEARGIQKPETKVTSN